MQDSLPFHLAKEINLISLNKINMFPALGLTNFLLYLNKLQNSEDSNLERQHLFEDNIHNKERK